MGWLGRIFGTEKALNKIVDGVSNGLDALVYTDEEKSEDAAKERAAARSMVVEWMRATQGQNLARRVIALVVTVLWVTQYLVAAVLAICTIWSSQPDNLIASSAVIKDAAQQTNAAFMLVLAFYFAAPHMGDIAKAALQKFGKASDK